MHFWIDKRSQACGFGRARVAASLSNSGGAGLGFGHYPPRRSKSMSMAAPIHRLQSQDFARPTYLQHQQHQQQQQLNNTNCNNNNTSNNTINRNSRNNSRQYEQYHNNIQCYQSQHQQLQTQQHHSQFIQNYENPPHASIRNQQQHHNLNIPLTCNTTTSIANNNSRTNTTNGNNNNNNNIVSNNYHHVSVPLPHIYGGSSQSALDLEQGTMGSINITRHQQHQQQQHQQQLLENQQHIANGHHNNIIENHETQLLPSHLKCGMWASLIVASVCVAGVKFYFDHQGTGLEVFIFFTFLAIFFWAACTVSLCPCPKKIPTTQPSSPIININNRHDDIIDDDNHNGISIRNHSQIFIDNNQEQLNQDIQLLSVATAAPPPYHIAILLPDTTTKELVEFDETPPPSYDKVLI